MSAPAVIFDGVWKKFRRGERHDSLRDLVPATFKRLVNRPAVDALDAQEFWALRDVSFEVKPGEALGIIGPNGAGKSTTLKLLTKILKPTKGRCEVRGRVGALIELAAGFHPDLTGRENVYLQGAIMGMTRPDIARRFDAIVDFAGVESFIDTQVKRYSSGMQARLGFAIAANLEPDVLIIDEVLAVGDFTFQQKCYERLARFRDDGVPIVLVSHNLQAIAKLCHRALLLQPGKPHVIGTANDITALWVGNVPSTGDPRATVTSSVLTLASGEPLPETIPPGTSLRLELECHVADALSRCGLAIHIVRSDGHEMFLGASNIDLPAGIEVSAGQSLHASVVLHPHLLRGVYVIHLRLLDTLRLWNEVVFHNVASFTIDETTRVSGCVDVYPEYSLRVGRDVPSPVGYAG